jgi:hypothetical protein
MPPMSRVGQQTQDGLPMYLFEYQANPQGSWVMADVAGCAI